MSNAPVSEEPAEATEQTEIIPMVNLEPPLSLPPPPASPPPPEDEWGPAPEHTNVDNASPFSISLYGIIPVILGIFSLLLLMLCGFFGYQYVQSVQLSESKLKNLNQWIESFQNKTENFFQVQKVLEENKETLEWLQRQNEDLMDALQELHVKQGHPCGPPLHRWVRYLDHCYHQSVEMVPWFHCSDLCISLNATFLKTERNRLMNILELLAVDQTWLGLSYKKTDNGWKWEDGSSPSSDLDLPEPSLDFQGKCAYVRAGLIDAGNCTTSSSCLCENAAH